MLKFLYTVWSNRNYILNFLSAKCFRGLGRVSSGHYGKNSSFRFSLLRFIPSNVQADCNNIEVIQKTVCQHFFYTLDDIN